MSIGRRVRRVEDERLITGRGRYAGDVRLDGLVHMAVHRAYLAHGRIRGISCDAARSAPGVLGVWTAADLPATAARVREDWAAPPLDEYSRPVLAIDEVNHAGEALAIVVAADPYLAGDAAGLIEADVEPLPAAGNLAAALATGSPPVHAAFATNVGRTDTAAFGDVDAAFGDAPIVVRDRLEMRRIYGAAMEPRAVTAAPDGEGGLTVWTSTQAVFSVREHLATYLGLDEARVAVVAEDVGGGFGPKGRTYPEEVLAAWAALRLGRPVRWIGARSEDSATTVHAHGTVFELELAADADGRLRGLRGELWHDIGAYASIGAMMPGNIVAHMLCGYRLPAMRMDQHVVFTNATPTGTVRGGGRPQGNFAIERMMDLLADRLGVAGAEVRRRNLIRPEELPRPAGLARRGQEIVYDSGDYPRLLEDALALIGEPGADPDGRLRGVGVAFGVESTGMGSGEPARVRIGEDGVAELFLGSTPQGQGHRTMAGQVLAERLGWPLKRIRVVAGDTRAVRGGGLTAGSRSAVHVGNAVAQAAVAARDELLRRAADVLEAAPSDLVLEDGVVRVRGVPGRSVPATAALCGETLDVTRTWDTATGTSWACSCHAADVAVDPETGAVSVCRYVIVHDSGREINPLIVEGQLHGGLVHGLGYALFEEAVFSADGDFLSATFLDYAMPSAPEVAFEPRLEARESHTPFNPEGVKGVGEAGTIPAPAAIAAAVEAAVRARNPRARVRLVPLTSDRVRGLL